MYIERIASSQKLGFFGCQGSISENRNQHNFTEDNSYQEYQIRRTTLMKKISNFGLIRKKLSTIQINGIAYIQKWFS